MTGAIGADEDDHRRCRVSAGVMEPGGHMTEIFGDDGGGGGGDDLTSSGVACSICLEFVTKDGVRSRAMLQCGHEFHLDCIGSAFNMKGSMQCPNCRKIEKGRWLYANGSTRPFPELIMEDWSPDEEFYGLSYPEMHYRVHWCPFGELSQVGSSFEEVESPTITYHEIQGHHALFAEHLAASSVGHSYVAYVGPVPAVTPRSSENIDESNLYHPWSGLSGQNETFIPHVVSVPYHGWDHHPPPFSIPGNPIPGAEPIHGETDVLAGTRSYPNPFVFGYRSNPRAGSSIVPSHVHRYPGSVQTHERIQISQSFHHQPPNSNVSAMSSPGIPLTRRGLQPPPPPPPPPPPQPDQNGGFYVFRPPSSSSQNPHEPEPEQHFHGWETTDWFSSFPVPSRDSPWGSHHRPTSSSSFWNRHSS